MSAETTIALAAFATLGHVVTAFWLRGHVWTAALAEMIIYLGMVICYCLNTYCRIATLGSTC